MKNSEAEARIISCIDELTIIREEIDNNKLSRINKYLIQYAIVCACASIEVSIKTIISDRVEVGANIDAINYLDMAIRNNSMNPKYSKIQNLMNDINKQWTKKLLEEVNKLPDHDRITTSLNNIVVNRNSIAHGRGASATIKEVIQWLTDSFEIVKIVDIVVNLEYVIE